MNNPSYPIVLRVAYDGEGYHGFQRQPHHHTIENKLLDAFEAFEMLQRENLADINYSTGGRTDTSVSAIEQTISFFSLREPIPAAINTYLPSNIWIWATTKVSKEFHARYDALQRTYIYFWPDQGYDIDLMNISAQKLEGQHDFANFCKKNPDVKSSIRSIDKIVIESQNGLCIFRFSAPSWLWEQCRRMVTHLLDVGSKKSSPEDTDKLLTFPHINKPNPAPPELLLLEKIDYAGINFTIDKNALKYIQNYFQNKYSSFISRAGLFKRIWEYFHEYSS